MPSMTTSDLILAYGGFAAVVTIFAAICLYSMRDTPPSR